MENALPQHQRTRFVSVDSHNRPHVRNVKDNTERVTKRNPNFPDTERICIFNVLNNTVPGVWDELKTILSNELFSCIKKVQRVLHAKKNPRYDIWVTRNVTSSIIRQIVINTRGRTRLNVEAAVSAGNGPEKFRRTIVSSWRPKIWQSWFDRRSNVGKVENYTRDMGRTMMTLNVVGYHKKMEVIKETLEDNNISICSLQETLVKGTDYPLIMPGYRVFAVPCGAGFRGQALLVDERASAYEIPHVGKVVRDYVLHVKVNGLKGINKPLHVLSVYMPSGGNYRAVRNAVWSDAVKIVTELTLKDPGTLVVMLGDFNMTDIRVDKLIARDNESLLCRLTPVGSPLSRFPIHGKPSAIDHMVVSTAMKELCSRPRVLRNACVSDHRPLIGGWKNYSDDFQPPKRPVSRINAKMLVRMSYEIASHNKWSVLPVEEISDADELTQSALAFSKCTNDVLMSCGALSIQDSGIPYRDYLNRDLRLLLIKYRVASEKVSNQVDLGQLDINTVTKYNDAKKEFRRSVKKHRVSQRQLFYSRVSKDFVAHEHKNVWSRLKNLVNSVPSGEVFPSVKDTNGLLQTEPTKIIETIREYYRALAHDDPLKISQNNVHWEHIDLGPKHPDMPNLNLEITWPECLSNIRRMNRNTSPGACNMHSNTLKVLVLEECMEHLRLTKEGFSRKDYVRIDLPEIELPLHPTTGMGKALYRLIKAVWALEVTPESWDEVYIVNLFKSGDPEILLNYRGLSLISVTFKVILGIMANRLLIESEKSDLISPEQSGFRNKEEAVSQFIAVSEVIRRRYLEGKSTVGIFIDFRKAYDRVYHEALYRVLEHMGVRGKFLALVKYMYSHSKMRVRVGGHLAEFFDMLRGNRQGCPLSPILFILFINSIWKNSPIDGVSIDRIFSRCKGGMFADDIVALASDPTEAQAVLTHIYEWGQKWGMELGIPKCGVMYWGDKNMIHHWYSETSFTTPEGEIPKVSTYKYLGINVDENWHRSREPLEGSENVESKHSARMARKGFNALEILRPVLRDRMCPLPLKVDFVKSLVIPSMVYGSEYTAFKAYHSFLLQRVVNVAARWIIGTRAKDTQYEAFSLCYELDLPNMEVVMGKARARLFGKLTQSDKKMRTWLQILSDTPVQNRKRTWFTHSKAYIKEILFTPPFAAGEKPKKGVNKYARFASPESSEDEYPEDHALHIPARKEKEILLEDKMPLRPWMSRGRVYELHNRSNQYTSTFLRDLNILSTGMDDDGFIVAGIDPQLVERNPSLNLYSEWVEQGKVDNIKNAQTRNSTQQDMIRNVGDCILERVASANRSVAFEYWYDKYQFGATRGYIRAALNKPTIQEGLRWLIAIRVRGFPRIRDRWTRMRFSGKIPAFEKETCPLCKKNVMDGWEWAHLLLKCTNDNAMRLRLPLHKYINDLDMWISELDHRNLDLAPITGVSDQNIFYGVIAIYLVGGAVNDLYDSPYHVSFGQTDILSHGDTKFVYERVAEFLQSIVPKYINLLRQSVYGVSSLEIDDQGSLSRNSVTSNTGENTGDDFPDIIVANIDGTLILEGDAA